MTRPKMPHEDRLVLVVWEDAWTSGNWVENAAAPSDPVLVHTAGFVLVEDDEGITLAQSMCLGEGGNIWRIPNGMIRGVYRLVPGAAA